MSLDLEQHLTFYGAYHHNSINIAIHMVCVPLILTSAFCMATYTGTLIPHHPGSPSPIWNSTLPFAGFLLAAFCMGGAAFGNYLRQQSPETTFQGALALHVVCWIFQFIGHGKFEGRAPALLDNLIQAIFLAPMFVWLEMLFKLGYRPELQARVNKKVQVEIEKFKAKAKNGKAQ
ncbi:hypothetical protein CEP54_015205 [Fusarium duplospermum]|uniref:DUF962 domain-containing protein n=1 Tax=Fusarium duplospermum TaxID=1325734 RepID=A0A428NQS9_9HYPO|nr:hypothetical protein CEP54_015205 [Fusarium duplospermum]